MLISTMRRSALSVPMVHLAGRFGYFSLSQCAGFGAREEGFAKRECEAERASAGREGGKYLPLGQFLLPQKIFWRE